MIEIVLFVSSLTGLPVAVALLLVHNLKGVK